MAKQARAPKKPAAVVVSAPVTHAPVIASPPRIVFGDLHVDNARLDRALRVLDAVGELQIKHSAEIVCLGDFWDLRGHWIVRHVEEVLKRIEQWRHSYFIPGNHDQVSLDGQIHGLNIFRAMAQHEVVTNPLYDQATRTAYLPWREQPAEQKALFTALNDGGAPWTVFGHAEVGGAVSNGGHVSPGYVQREDIEVAARACYLAHYHKRQQIGDRTWYISSPFQQNIGEREWPHGVALIHPDVVEPEFIDLKGFPRYWRLSALDAWDASEIAEHDIVELQTPPEAVNTDDYRELIASIPAKDVRPVMVRAEEDIAPPEFALTLDDAVEQWAVQAVGEEATPDTLDVVDVVAAGRAILGEVPEARAIPPLGTRVDLLSIRTQDFCALRGELQVDVSKHARALIQAPIRTGKTALLDAPMWCLYGETTPRKPGAQGATLRADNVIHDAASMCSVECVFAVHTLTGVKEVTITREKKRGAGSRVHIDGIDKPAGISDQDALVRHVIGLSHPLWRTCVSLGQGAVGNFATDADKRRKDLLNEAFGLEACPKAQKVAKQRRDVARGELDHQRRELATSTGAKEALLLQDVTQQQLDWVSRRDAAVLALNATAAEAAGKAQQCEEMLAGEAAWISAKSQHNAHITSTTGRLASQRPTARIAELQRQWGAVEAERAVAMREHTQANDHYKQMVAAGEAVTCTTCGQALPMAAREGHMLAAESKIRGSAEQIRTFEHRLSNLAQELDQLNTGGNAEQAALEATIAESRKALEQCDTAIAQYARIRSNKEAAQQQQGEALRRAAEEQATPNPFDLLARDNAVRIAQLQLKIDDLELKIAVSKKTDQLNDLWVEGFGPKGLPVLVLRTALYDLEAATNRYLAELLAGTVHCQLSMEGDDLHVSYFERSADGLTRERVYEQLSGGQRRCVEIAFAPLALSDMLFARCGVRVTFLEIDELTTHLGADEKALMCAMLERIDRKTIWVVDHDVSVQGHFDTKLRLRTDQTSSELVQV